MNMNTSFEGKILLRYISRGKPSISFAQPKGHEPSLSLSPIDGKSTGKYQADPYQVDGCYLVPGKQLDGKNTERIQRYTGPLTAKITGFKKPGLLCIKKKKCCFFKN